MNKRVHDDVVKTPGDNIGNHPGAGPGRSVRLDLLLEQDILSIRQALDSISTITKKMKYPSGFDSILATLFADLNKLESIIR